MNLIKPIAAIAPLRRLVDAIKLIYFSNFSAVVEYNCRNHNFRLHAQLLPEKV